MTPHLRPAPIRNRTFSIAAATAGVFLAFTGCASVPSTSAPNDANASGALTAVNCGRELTVTEPPTNVLIGYPTIWETLDALGVGNSVTGYLTGDLTDLPEGASSSIVEVSPDYHVPRETVLSFEPDLALFSTETQLSGQNGEATFDDLAAGGIPAFMFQGNCADDALKTDDDLATVYADIKALGSLYDKQAEAAALVADLEVRVADAAALRDNAPAPTVAFIQIYDGTIYALGLGNYAAVLDAIGAENYFADITSSLAYVEVSAETALSIDADHLVIVHYNDQTPEAAVAAIEELLPNAAPVANGRVSAAHTDNFQVGGVPLIDVTVDIAEAVYRR